MRLYKPGNMWWFKLQFEGKLYRKSTKHTNKIKAVPRPRHFIQRWPIGISELSSANRFPFAVTP
jgi:hypothetical protein